MKAVFLDKDGTLVENFPYNTDPNRIRLTAGAVSGLSKLARAGYNLIVVSNQSGVARGYFPESALLHVWEKLQSLLRGSRIVLTDFLYCPHHPDGNVPSLSFECSCRKPEPGLLFEAARRHPLDLEASWMIGDILDDVEAGNRAGCRTVLINNGNETEWRLSPEREPTFLARNLDKAADIILAAEKQSADGPAFNRNTGVHDEI